MIVLVTVVVVSVEEKVFTELLTPQSESPSKLGRHLLSLRHLELGRVRMDERLSCFGVVVPKQRTLLEDPDEVGIHGGVERLVTAKVIDRFAGGLYQGIAAGWLVLRVLGEFLCGAVRAWIESRHDGEYYRSHWHNYSRHFSMNKGFAT